MHEKNPFFFVSVLETAKPVSFQKHKKIRNNVKETTDKYHYGDHITALDRASTNPHRNQVQSMVSLFFSANRTCSVFLSLHLSCSPTSISIRTSTHTHTLSLSPALPQFSTFQLPYISPLFPPFVSSIAAPLWFCLDHLSSSCFFTSRSFVRFLTSSSQSSLRSPPPGSCL